MDRNQLRNQEFRTLGSLDLIMDSMDRARALRANVAYRHPCSVLHNVSWQRHLLVR